MTEIVAVDPGYEQSAYVVLEVPTCHVDGHGRMSNDEMLEWLRSQPSGEAILVLETIESFGMAVGREVFETVFMTGRFAEAWYPHRAERIPRRLVKTHLCHSARATDSNIRQALVDRFGPTKAQAIGTKKQPGPLYGIKSDEWSALALAITFWDTTGWVERVPPTVVAQW